MESKAGRGVGWVLPFSLVCVGLALLAGPELPWPSYHPSPPRSPEQWRQERTKLSSGLRDLRVQFSNQTRPAWTLVAASLKAPMQPLPDYPAVLLLLVGTEAALPTAGCLASRLVRLSSAGLAPAPPGLVPPPASQLTIEAALLPQTDEGAAKAELTQELHRLLGTWGAAGISSLHLLAPAPALTLHAFADNSNAPYKQAALVATLVAGPGAEPGCQLERRAEAALSAVWAEQLGQDKLAALLSRLVVSVAEVNQESAETLSAIC